MLETLTFIKCQFIALLEGLQLLKLELLFVEFLIIYFASVANTPNPRLFLAFLNIILATSFKGASLFLLKSFQ